MQEEPHHPVLKSKPDGRWLVRCPECEQGEVAAIPIGIAMPLESQSMAELILTNHLSRAMQRREKEMALAVP